MSAVVLLEEAYADLEKGRDFYDDQEPGLGEYFASPVLHDINPLQTLHSFHSRRFGVHWFLASKFPFGIYYVAKENRIIVVAILDQRSRPSSIKRKIKSRR